MRDRKAKVSVIVVNFNGMPYLETCLRSVIAQSYPDFEAILVDNNSSDGSLAYARERFPDLLIAANEKNLGYTGRVCYQDLSLLCPGHNYPSRQDAYSGNRRLSMMLSNVEAQSAR